jgi:hypothetical protein
MVDMDPRIPPRPDRGSLSDWEQLDLTPRPMRHRRRWVALVATIVAGTLVIGAVAGGIDVSQNIGPRGSSNDYRFLAVIGGQPVRWNPCEPIHYVIDPGLAPDGSVDDVHEAIAKISTATGIPFVFDGLSTEIPQRDRQPYDPATYGQRWAPVLIAWVTPSQTDIAFSGNGHDFAAVARPLTAPDDPRQFVSGWVAVNELDPNPPGWSEPGDQGPTVLHELGHIMGLNHVPSKAELMEASGGLVTDLGPGDREGLALLGREAGCLTEPSLP